MLLYLSSKVKEQGTVTQDPLSVVTLAGTRTLNFAALHPAPLKQEVDKSKGSIDSQTVKKTFECNIGLATKQDHLAESIYYY
jgi:hypothetical protein